MKNVLKLVVGVFFLASSFSALAQSAPGSYVQSLLQSGYSVCHLYKATYICENGAIVDSTMDCVVFDAELFCPKSTPSGHTQSNCTPYKGTQICADRP